MIITKNIDGETLTFTLEGRLDTTTSPQLEAELKQSVGGVTELIFDFSGVEYISSAGLRVLLAAQKVMNRQGSMKLTGVNENVLEVFEITGFIDILTSKYHGLPPIYSQSYYTENKKLHKGLPCNCTFLHNCK